MPDTQHISPIDLVAFTEAHLDGALVLSRQAAWPHRREDWAMGLALSKGIIAQDADGDVVGTILATLYKQDCATINMVIVAEAMRGRGLGRKLMDAAFAEIADRPVRLIATQDGLPLYQKMGFVQTGTVMQHQGIPTEAPAFSVDVTLEDSVDIQAMTALDRAAFGADRSDLMQSLSQVARFAVLRRDGAIVGFAALRAFGRGEVIGPVVAETTQDAKDLIACCVASRPGAFLRVDTTEDTGLSEWLNSLGLAHVGGGIAMVRGTDPRSPAAVRTFALANQAFG